MIRPNADEQFAKATRFYADVALKAENYRKALELYGEARDAYVIYGDLSLSTICMDGMNSALIGIRKTDPEHFKEMGYKVFWEEEGESEESGIVKKIKKSKRKKK